MTDDTTTTTAPDTPGGRLAAEVNAAKAAEAAEAQERTERRTERLDELAAERRGDQPADRPSDPVESEEPDSATPSGDEPADGARKALDAERRARRDAERQLKATQRELLERERRDVAAEHGLPDAIAERLVGATREELVADAEALVDALRAHDRPSHRPRPKSSLINPLSDGHTSSVASIADDIIRRT